MGIQVRETFRLSHLEGCIGIDPRRRGSQAKMLVDGISASGICIDKKTWGRTRNKKWSSLEHCLSQRSSGKWKGILTFHVLLRHEWADLKTPEQKSTLIRIAHSWDNLAATQDKEVQEVSGWEQQASGPKIQKNLRSRGSWRRGEDCWEVNVSEGRKGECSRGVRCTGGQAGPPQPSFHLVVFVVSPYKQVVDFSYFFPKANIF